MEADTDRQGADAHLDNDPLMQAALANDETGVDSSTPAGNGAEAYSQDAQIGEEQQQEAQKPPAQQQPELSPQFSGILKDLLGERERRQKAEREAEALRQWRAEQERQKQAPDFYTEPVKAAQHENQLFFQQQVAPVLQQMQEARLFDARQIAYQIHGKDKADAAIKAFDELATPAERQQVMSSHNPFLAAGEWYSRKQVIDEVGTDPQKYREKLQSDLLKDPAFLAKAIEAAQAQAAGNPAFVSGQRPPPSNATRLPSVAKVGSAAGITSTQETDWSDDETLARLADPPRRRG